MLLRDGVAGTIRRGDRTAGLEALPTVEEAVPAGANAPARNQMFKDEHQMFIDCIEGRTTPEAHGLSAADGLVAQHVIDQAAASVQTGAVAAMPAGVGSHVAPKL